MPPNTRPCVVCGTLFVRNGRKIMCGPKCAAVRQLAQLTEIAARVKQDNKRRRAKKTCPICETKFFPSHANQKYDKPECQAKGLERAILAQAERRRVAKIKKSRVPTG